MGSLIFGIFSGVIVIILAVLQYHEKLKDENAVIERQKKVDSANSVLIASQQQLITQSIDQLHMSEKIGALQDKLLAETDKNALLQKELYESVTGGGTIPILLFFQDMISPNEPPGYLTCQIMNDGKYPIRNLHVTYFDLFKLSEQQLYDKSSSPTVKVLTGELESVKVVHNIGMVAINSMIPNVFTIAVRPTIAEKVFYTLQLSWDNGKASINIPFEPNDHGQTRLGHIRYYDQAGVEYQPKYSSKSYDVIIPGH